MRSKTWAGLEKRSRPLASVSHVLIAGRRWTAFSNAHKLRWAIKVCEFARHARFRDRQRQKRAVPSRGRAEPRQENAKHERHRQSEPDRKIPRNGRADQG